MKTDIPIQWLKTAFFIVVVLTLITTCFAAYHRLPWSDEGWLSSSSYNLATNHSPGMPVLRELNYGWKVTRIEQRNYWVFPGMIAGQALWYQLFPASIFWTRMFSLLWLPLALAGVFFYLRSLFPERAAVPWLAIILMAGNFVVLDNASFGRADMACVALGLGALAVYSSGRIENMNRALFGAHFLVVLSGMMHPDGIYHWITLMTLILWLDLKRIRLSSVIVSAIPYLVMGALWAWYLLQDPQAARDQLTANAGSRFPGWNPLMLLWRELERYATAYGLVTGGLNRLKLFSLAFCWAAVIANLWVKDLRSQSPVRLLLTQCGLVFVGLCVFNEKSNYYLLHIVPFYLMLAALWIDWLWSHRPRLRLLIPAAVAGLMLVDTAGVLYKSYSRSQVQEQRAALQFVRENAKPQDVIMGSAELVYGLNFDARLIDDPFLGLYSGRTAQMVIVDPIYQMLYEDYQRQGAAKERLVHDKFVQSYRKAYSTANYQVWLLPDRQ